MQLHNFHIPVMGIGFTIDTPIKVAHLGISSVISLVDDMLTERLREFYCSKYEMPFTSIPQKSDDSRAERITAYLNMVNEIVNKNFENFKKSLSEKKEELHNFINLLPNHSKIKESLSKEGDTPSTSRIKEIIQQYLHPGSIDVNIMTKLDKENYKEGEKLPIEFNDAHAALRGFAKSNLHSAIVLSAGMSPRLYTYMENFEDFYPNEDASFNKRIIIKVSDYRSAIVQGKMFAKKGLWVSEYRVESGLNCGGHVFATQGLLMGPILEEFSNNRHQLHEELFEIYSKGLEAKGKKAPLTAPEMRLTAQGGLGTAEEHTFLQKKYNLDSVGWGSPFLLVPEAASIDDATLQLLAKGGEEDYYLSDVSPVGVKFNNIKGTSRDVEQQELIKAGKPGAACTKKFLVSNKEVSELPICTASREYQRKKIQLLDEKALSAEEYQKEFDQITAKSCLCNGLGVATLNSHKLNTKFEGAGVSVCPGPNLAYFSKESTLSEMVNHIYGRINLITHPKRPNLFMKELDMYFDFFKDELEKISEPDARQEKNWKEYLSNLSLGMDYYEELFKENNGWSNETINSVLTDLKKYRNKHAEVSMDLNNILHRNAVSV